MGGRESGSDGAGQGRGLESEGRGLERDGRGLKREGWSFMSEGAWLHRGVVLSQRGRGLVEGEVVCGRGFIP